MRQEQSLARLGVDHVDIVLLHDPNFAPDVDLQVALEALRSAQARGLLTAIGVGAYDPAFLLSIVRQFDVDCVLAAGGCSLLDRPTPWVLA